MTQFRSKACICCGLTKPLDEYYVHKQMADGHLNKCKDCVKKAVRANRKSKLEYYRQYDRKRGSRQTQKYRRQWRSSNVQKYKAHNSVNNAVRDNKLTKPSACEICGTTDAIIHGHHADYGRPLEVVWVCPACHASKHGDED